MAVLLPVAQEDRNRANWEDFEEVCILIRRKENDPSTVDTCLRKEQASQGQPCSASTWLPAGRLQTNSQSPGKGRGLSCSRVALWAPLLFLGLGG